MMKSNVICAFAAVILLAACDKKDPIFNTSHPDHGTVTLTTDWSAIGSGLSAPDSYMVKAGTYSATLTGVTNRLDHLFAPGEYRFYVYNTPEHISFDDTKASVPEETDALEAAGKFIWNNPGWLFTAALDAAIARDSEYDLTAKMHQQVREFTLMLDSKNGTVEEMQSFEGYLTGAASTLDMANGTHGAPANVNLPFTKIASGADAGKWKATVRLLGVAGTEQKVYIKMNYGGEVPGMINLQCDLSDVLADFNSDKRTPFTYTWFIDQTPAQ